MQKEKSIQKEKFSSVLLFVVVVGGAMVLGFLSGMLSGASAGYDGYARPPLTPPDTTFSVVWPVLYFLTGISFYLMLTTIVEQKNLAAKRASIIIWAVQLALNLMWPFLFFALYLKTVAFIVSTVMTVCVLAVVVMDFFYCKPAAWLNIPYLIWLAFATYLGMYIALYN